MKTYWAQIDADNIVTQVQVWDDSLSDGDRETQLAEQFGLTWKRCDKFTIGGIRYESDYATVAEDQTLALRYNYPGTGFTYDADADAFIPPQPEGVESVLNTTTYLWEPPPVA